MTETIRLATRGSDLALRQARSVAERLEGRRRDVELVTVETTGDQLRDELIHRLGKTGAFARSVDEAVLAGDAEAAVHSMKDVPTESPDDLVLAAVPERGPPGDVLVTRDGSSLDDLPEGAVVGTSSLRRRAQLLSERPNLEVEPLRGNVDTRVQKLLAPGLQAEHERRMEAEREKKGETGQKADDEAGDEELRETDHDHPYDRTPDEWFEDLSEFERQAAEREVDVEYDAIVLAEAGLDRIGLLDRVQYQRLPIEHFVPAPGQGVLAVTAVDDATVDALRDRLDHSRTRVEATVERAILAELGGGCVAPLGVHALVQGGYANARIQASSRDGDEVIEATRDLPIERHAGAAREFAADVADRGARELIDRAKREAGVDEAEEGASDVGGEES